MPDMDTYFGMYQQPSILNPIMDPTQNIEDFQAVTIANAGLDNHDFGMGWRDQMNRINSGASSAVPININANSVEMPDPTNISPETLTIALRDILNRAGYEGSVVNVSSSYAMSDSCDLVINIKRDSTNNIIKTNYGNILNK